MIFYRRTELTAIKYIYRWYFVQCPQNDVRRHFAAAAATGPTQPYEIFLTTTQPVMEHNQKPNVF